MYLHVYACTHAHTVRIGTGPSKIRFIHTPSMDLYIYNINIYICIYVHIGMLYVRLRRRVLCPDLRPPAESGLELDMLYVWCPRGKIFEKISRFLGGVRLIYCHSRQRRDKEHSPHF